MSVVQLGSLDLGRGHPLALICGPCVVEAEALMRLTARQLCEICGEAGVPLIFKSSFQKDNRTFPDSFRGPGPAEGLEILAGLRAEFGFPLLSDVHQPHQVGAAAEVLDVLQIPAFLCRQTSLLEAAGQSGRAVNIKKGQFMSPGAMQGAVDKVRGAGGGQVLLTERGNSFGYDSVVCDMTNIPLLQDLGCPVVFDGGHPARERAHIPVLARCGVAAGADALYVECHPDPPSALCDGSRSLTPVELRSLVRQILPLARQVREVD